MPDRSIIFALVFFVDVLLGQELVLKPTGDVFPKAVGSSMVISCSVSQGSGETTSPTSTGLHWIDPSNREVTSKTGRVYVETEEDVKKLYVTSIQEADAGRYMCRSKIGGSWQQSAIDLVVFKEITFDDAPAVQNPAIDTDALILCKVSAIPTPQMSWRYEGQRVHYGDRFTKEADGLRIHAIKESDNGNYTCRAEIGTDGRYDEQKIEVTVHIPPKITLQLKDEKGVQGTDHALSCKASGLPSPLYQFFKDDSTEPIASTDRIHIESSTGDIYFSPLEKIDEGRFTCRVTNSAGSDSTVGELRVFVPPVIEPLSEVVVAEGDTAIIECRSHGDPSPEMTFHRMDARHGYDIGQNDNGRIIVTSEASGQLVVSISNTVPSDSGNFTCRARSSVGSDEQTGTMKVEFRPRFYESQPSVEYIWAGKTHNMTCQVSSEPEATIEWFRGGGLIGNNETFHVFNLGETSYLQVRVREADQFWIYGQYRCRATNKLGTIETTIGLQRASVPDAPKSVELDVAFPTTVILRATVPEENGGIEVFGYRVEYEDKAQDFTLGDEIRIDNLKASTTFIFRVRAKNEVGIGRGSEISVSTAAIRQPYAVDITSLPLGSEAYGYTVEWKPPITGGLDINKFKFSYRKVLVIPGSFNISQPLEDWSVFETDDLPLHYYKLEELQPLSYYELEIRSHNDMGWSEPNRQFVFVTAEDLFATTRSSTPSMTTSDLSPSSQGDPPSADATIASAVVPTTAVDLDYDHHANVLSDAANGSDSEGSEGTPNPVQDASTTIPIVVVVIVILLLFLVIIDVSCYFMNACGLTMFICVHICGREPQKVKDRAMEEGESDKKPLSEDVIQEMEPLAHYTSGDSEYKVPLRDGAEQSPSQGEEYGQDARFRLKHVAETDETEDSDVLQQEAVVQYERDSLGDNGAMEDDEPVRTVT